MLADPRAERRALLLVAGLGALLRLGWVLYAARRPEGLHDPALYLFYGEAIAAGEGYHALDGKPTAYYPPAFPFLVGALAWVARQLSIADVPLLVGLVHVVLGVVSILLVHRIARALLGAGPALVAAAVTAFLPNLVFHSATLLSETLFITLVLAAMAVITDRPPPLTRGRLVAFGALLGLSALTRPVSLVLVAALFAALWLGGLGARRGLAQAAAALVVALVVIAPWTVRNLVVMDAPVLISTNLGDDACIGHNPAANGAFRFTRACAAAEGLPEVEQSSEGTRRALAYLTSHPGAEVLLIAKRAYYLFEHDHDALRAVESYGDGPFLPGALRRGLALVADVAFFVLLVVALLGIPALGRGRDPRRLLVLLAPGALLLPPLAFFGDPRFHVPAVPLLGVLAAAALGARYRRGPKTANAPPS